MVYLSSAVCEVKGPPSPPLPPSPRQCPSAPRPHPYRVVFCGKFHRASGNVPVDKRDLRKWEFALAAAALLDLLNGSVPATVDFIASLFR